MSDTVIVGLLSLAGTACGVFGGIQLINYRLKQLECKVDKHNNLVERMYKVESRITICEERLEK